MPTSLSTGLVLMLLAGVALAGLASWNLLAQKTAHTQTAQQEQTDQPVNVRIYGDETIIDGQRLGGESAPQQTQQRAVGGGPVDELLSPQQAVDAQMNQQQSEHRQFEHRQSEQSEQQAQPTAPGQPQTVPADQRTGSDQMLSAEQVQQQFQQQLDQRATELDQRELALNEREQTLEEREAALDALELDLEQWQADLEAWQAELEDESAALEQQASASQQRAGPPSLGITDKSRGTFQQYEYDAASGTTIEERPVLERPAPRKPTPPMRPGEEDAPYWIFYGYY